MKDNLILKFDDTTNGKATDGEDMASAIRHFGIARQKALSISEHNQFTADTFKAK